jgi:hypothetical protein
MTVNGRFCAFVLVGGLVAGASAFAQEELPPVETVLMPDAPAPPEEGEEPPAPEPPPPPAPRSRAAAPRPPVPEGGSGPSRAEMVAQSTGLVESMANALQQVSEMRDAASGDEGDAERYQCLTSEWSAMNGRMRVAESAAAALATAADDATASQQFDLITAASAGMDQGLAKALRCGEESDFTGGDGEMQSVVDPRIPAGPVGNGTGDAGRNVLGGPRDETQPNRTPTN